MKIRNAMILKIAALFALGCASACQTNNSVSNNNSANQSSNKGEINVTQSENKTTNVNQTENKKTETTETFSGSLATPTEAYKTAYAARKNKDIAGLKRVLSKDALDFFAMIAEAEKKTVDEELLKMTETPQASTDESRSEKITGNTATIEYPDETGKWKKLDFIKEGADWKITFPKPDPSEIKAEQMKKK